MTASQVLQRFGRSVPVDPEAIARAAGIMVKGAAEDAAFWEVPYGGRYVGSDEDGLPVIYVDRSEPTVRQRFTIAHELGHHFLQHGNSFRDGPANFDAAVSQPQEIAANRFAAELLMPTEVVTAAAARTPDLESLAKGFAVSQVAMKFRLQNLGLISAA